MPSRGAPGQVRRERTSRVKVLRSSGSREHPPRPMALRRLRITGPGSSRESPARHRPPESTDREINAPRKSEQLACARQSRAGTRPVRSAMRILSISLHDTRPKRAIGAESSGKLSFPAHALPDTLLERFPTRRAAITAWCGISHGSTASARFRVIPPPFCVPAECARRLGLARRRRALARGSVERPHRPATEAVEGSAGRQLVFLRQQFALDKGDIGIGARVIKGPMASAKSRLRP